jgi:hypothetical protein
VLFTFPSWYWFTIGRQVYLALGSGLPSFQQDFSCPAVLRIPTHQRLVSHTGLSPALASLSSAVLFPPLACCRSYNPKMTSHLGLGCSAFARHYSRNDFFSSGYLDVSVPRVPRSCAMCSRTALVAFPTRGFPIRTSTAYRLGTPPRRFSQCHTSFFGS